MPNLATVYKNKAEAWGSISAAVPNRTNERKVLFPAPLASRYVGMPVDYWEGDLSPRRIRVAAFKWGLKF